MWSLNPSLCDREDSWLLSTCIGFLPDPTEGQVVNSVDYCKLSFEWMDSSGWTVMGGGGQVALRGIKEKTCCRRIRFNVIAPRTDTDLIS